MSSLIWLCLHVVTKHLYLQLVKNGTGKTGNPFQTTQGNRLSCRDQEGRRGSEEAVPGPSVFPSREPGVSGGFWESQEGCQGPSRPSGRNRGLPLSTFLGGSAAAEHGAKCCSPAGSSQSCQGVYTTRPSPCFLRFISRRPEKQPGCFLDTSVNAGGEEALVLFPVLTLGGEVSEGQAQATTWRGSWNTLRG